MPINRRDFLSTLGATAALMASTRVTGAQSAPLPAGTQSSFAGRPNILLMIGDDHTWTDAGCYGNKEVQTPSIDRLAKESMRFTNAHTATAMCVPSRSMLYTGLYPIKNGAFPNHSRIYPNIKSIVQYLKPLGYRVGLAGKVHVGPREQFDFEYLSLDPKEIEAFMVKPGRFCLIYASHHPHAPWGNGIYDPAKLTLPPYLPDTPEARQALANYYFEVTQLDKEVGTCLDLLEKNKLVDNTLTIYTSEQGAPFPHGKWTCYDIGLRVQFIARWPGRIQPNSTNEALICYADFVPTAIELAGGPPPPGLDGKSLVPLLAGKNVELHDAVFGVHTTRGIIRGSESYPIRSIRTKTHKYIWNIQHDATFKNIITVPRAGEKPGGYWASWVEKAKTDPGTKKIIDAYQQRPEEELYDLAADPGETNNRAGDPQHAQLKASLRKRLENFMKEQGDNGIATEMEAKKRQAPGVGTE